MVSASCLCHQILHSEDRDTVLGLFPGNKPLSMMQNFEGQQIRRHVYQVMQFYHQGGIQLTSTPQAGTLVVISKIFIPFSLQSSPV
jgi:hypothetical protein